MQSLRFCQFQLCTSTSDTDTEITYDDKPVDCVLEVHKSVKNEHA